MTLREQLKRDEGIRYTGYQDSKGRWTIGVGHCIETGPPLSAQVTSLILDDDIKFFTAEVVRRAPWIATIPQRKHDALINLAFNVGINGFFRFQKMLVAARYSNWATAAAEMRDSAVWRSENHDRIERLAVILES